MGLAELTRRFPWQRYSKKLRSRIEKPRSIGFFSADEAKERGLRRAVGIDGEVEDGNAVHLYWLLDPNDGVILDSRFQVFGQTALIGAAEAACELLIGKNYDQAHRIVTADFIDRHLRDRSDEQAFPNETFAHLNLVISAIDHAVEQCMDIPVAADYVSPVPESVGDVLEGGYPGWDTFTLKQKLALINQVMDEHIRPYVAMDDGGVEVLNLIDDRELIIAYQGTCTSCFSAVGATLGYIQKTLRAKVHPDLVVVPDMPDDFGHFGPG
ncbi:MAG: NifU family protein [Chlamydiia bacterium]|nr:NifU family protein [Chlamydiia bacterium]